MAVISRPNFGDLLAPGFRQIFFQKFGERPPEYTELFNMLTSTRQYEDDSYVSGFGTIPLKSEGVEMDSDDVMQGFDQRYTHDTYSLQYRITEEMAEDELYGIMKKLPSAIGRSMRSTIEIDGANMYNNAFDTTNYADGGDGKALLTTDHPLLDGSTQKNELTTGADLNATSFEQALLDIAATTDDRGLKVHLKPIKLVVHPANEWNAMKLLKSTLDPDSANNAINPAMNQLRIVVNHYLTDTDAWFVLCDTHELNWFWRVKPDHEQGNDFGSGDAKFKVRARWKRGWSLPWGLFGSPGA